MRRNLPFVLALLACLVFMLMLCVLGWAHP